MYCYKVKTIQSLICINPRLLYQYLFLCSNSFAHPQLTAFLSIQFYHDYRSSVWIQNKDHLLASAKEPISFHALPIIVSSILSFLNFSSLLPYHHQHKSMVYYLSCKSKTKNLPSPHIPGYPLFPVSPPSQKIFSYSFYILFFHHFKTLQLVFHFYHTTKCSYTHQHRVAKSSCQF